MKITTYASMLLMGTSVGLCAGCSSNAQEPKTAQQGWGEMYQDKRQSELTEARQEFINDKQQELNEIDNSINRLQAKLDHEVEYVDQEQEADWKQELWELKQERQSLQAKLERAQTASDAEWSNMRGTLGGAVDSLESAVGTLAGQVEQAMTDETERKQQQQQDQPGD